MRQMKGTPQSDTKERFISDQFCLQQMIVRKLLVQSALKHQLFLKGSFPFAKMFESNPAANAKKLERRQQQFKKYSAPADMKGIKHTHNQAFQLILEQAQTLGELLKLKSDVFSVESRFISSYLRNIRLQMNEGAYQEFKTELYELHGKLQQFSQFEVPANEFIEILLFHARFKELQNKVIFGFNFGFQKKAFDFASSQIYNKAYSLSQVIAIYELMIKLDGNNLLLLMNLIKFLKQQFEKKVERTIKLEHILTIFNTYLLKVNHIPLQNIICDQTLHYFLTHYEELLKQTTTVIKTDILGAVMLIDIKNTYKSNKSQRRLVIVKLLREIQGKMKGEWLFNLINEEKSEFKEENVDYYQVVYLLDCIEFMRENKMEHQSYHSEFQTFLQTVYLSLKQMHTQIRQCEIKSEHKVEIIVRILFHPQIIYRWIDESEMKSSVLSLLHKITFDKEKSLNPIVDLIRLKYDIRFKDTLIQILSTITMNLLNKGIINMPSIALLLEYYSSDESIKLMMKLRGIQDKQIRSGKQLLNLLFIYSLIVKRHRQNSNIANAIPTSKELLNKIIRNESTNKSLVKNLYKTVESLKNYQNIEVLEEVLEQFLRNLPLFTSSIFSLNQNLVVSEASLMMTELLFTVAANKKGPISSELDHIFQKVKGNDVLRHQLLSKLYPESYPNPKTYEKRINLLSSSKSFKNNVQFMAKHFDHDKYSYFIWDIVMKNYIKQSKQVRKQTYDLLEQIFMKAFIKEKARKIIHLTVFSNYMCSGVMIAPKSRIQKVFEKAIDLILASQQDLQFHHQCYLQIVGNTLSMNILSMEYFLKIMEYSNKQEKETKPYCTLMLLIGSNLKYCSMTTHFLTAEQLQAQLQYLRFLIKSNFIKNMGLDNNIQSNEDISKKPKRIIYLQGKLVMILLKFLKGQIVTIGDIIMKYIQQNNEYSEWTGIAYSFNRNDFSDKDSKQRTFKMKFKTIMKIKLQFFKKMDILSEQDEKNLLEKLK